ncbi:XRE family transcriptional regulator [Butyricimonas sp.]|uniref:XRE family transcriptional regulator n=1 Tax=Butyricimonas sp. TaxID=1969738 RepID=UPI0025BC624B|nr:XRE family transcriptional regulator [Butyricimonas sp.]
MTAIQDTKNKRTEIEIFVINKVKEFRIAAKLSKRKLSLELGLNYNYVFQAESPDYDTKYNLNHLNEIAKILKCSVADFMPTPHVKQNTIEEFLRLHPKQKAKNEKMSQDNEEKGRVKREAKAKTKKK